MANFTFTWDDGSVTSLPLPTDDVWTCDNISPSPEFLDIGGDIVLYATQTSNWQNVEDYCIMGISTLTALYDKAQLIKDQWDTMEIQCADFNNWFQYCSNQSAFCNMTENELESAYYNWADLPSSLLNNIQSLLQVQTLANQQVGIDIAQAQALAVLQQQIAETNNLISLTAYQNEVREVDTLTKKTKDIFVPIIIVLLLAGLGVYLIKD